MGDQHHRRIQVHERLLEPLQRLDVEMVGGLVEQQHVGARRERARQRGPRELPSGEGVQRPVEVGLGEPEPVGHRGGAVAPQVAAAGLELRLRPGVAAEQRLVGLPRCSSGPRARRAAPRSRAPPRSRRAGTSRSAISRSRGGRWSCSAIRTPLATLSSPRSIVLSPASIRSSVVLPAPLRPAIVMRSRRSSLNDTPLSSGLPAMSL